MYLVLSPVYTSMVPWSLSPVAVNLEVRPPTESAWPPCNQSGNFRFVCCICISSTTCTMMSVLINASVVYVRCLGFVHRWYDTNPSSIDPPGTCFRVSPRSFLFNYTEHYVMKKLPWPISGQILHSFQLCLTSHYKEIIHAPIRAKIKFVAPFSKKNNLDPYLGMIHIFSFNYVAPSIMLYCPYLDMKH